MLAALQATDHDINSNVMCVIWYFCDNWPANEKEKKTILTMMSLCFITIKDTNVFNLEDAEQVENRVAKLVRRLLPMEYIILERLVSCSFSSET